MTETQTANTKEGRRATPSPGLNSKQQDRGEQAKEDNYHELVYQKKTKGNIGLFYSFIYLLLFCVCILDRQVEA